MPLKPTRRAGVALLLSATAGAGAALIGSAAARPHDPHQGQKAQPGAHAQGQKAQNRRRGGLRGPARRAVHVEAVVPKPGGGGFTTATIDRGRITSISGSKLTLRQGNKKGTWRTQSFAIPSDARVVIDHRQGELSGAREGQVAVVAKLPKRTVVRVHDKRR